MFFIFLWNKANEQSFFSKESFIPFYSNKNKYTLIVTIQF